MNRDNILSAQNFNFGDGISATESDVSMVPSEENSSTLFNRHQNSIVFSHYLLFRYLLIFNYKVLWIHCLTLRSTDHHFKE